MNDSAQYVNAVILPHPFKMERVRRAFTPGLTVAEILKESGIHPGTPAKVWLNGEPVERAFKPKAGDLLNVRVVPQGGGSDVMGILMTVFSAALMFAIPGAGFGILALKVGLGLGIGLVGNLIKSALVPPPTPSTAKLTSVPQSYTISGIQNQAAPYAAVPRIFGKRRIYPMLGGAPYNTQAFDGSSDQYLTMHFILGYGPLAISDLKIGETDLDQFIGVEKNILPGHLDDPPLQLYSGINVPVQLSLLLLDTANANRTGTGWHQQSTDPLTQGIVLEFTWPSGLCVVGKTSGNRQWAEVHISIQYSLFGLNQWVSVPDLVVRAYDSGAVRRTKTISPTGWTTPRQYDVRCQFSGLAVYKNDFGNPFFATTYWTSLRSTRFGNLVNRKGIAQIELRIKASNQLNGVIDKFNCIAQSVLPDYSTSGSKNQAAHWVYNYRAGDSGTYALQTAQTHSAGRALAVSLLTGAGNHTTFVSEGIPVRAGYVLRAAIWHKASVANVPIEVVAYFGTTPRFILPTDITTGPGVKAPQFVSAPYYTFNGVSGTSWAICDTLFIHVPDKMTYMRLAIKVTGLASGPVTVYFDDAAVSTEYFNESHVPNNLVTNPSFEARLPHTSLVLPDQWSEFWADNVNEFVAGVDWLQDRKHYHGGAACLRVVIEHPSIALNRVAFRSTEWAVAPGESYQVATLVRLGDFGRIAMTPGNNIGVYLEFTTLTGTFGDAQSTLFTVPGALGQTWLPIGGIATVPANMHFARLVVMAGSDGVASSPTDITDHMIRILFDDCMCVKIDPSGATAPVNGLLINPSFEHDTYAVSATSVGTSNPAHAFREILMGSANANPVTVDRLDNATLDAWEAECIAAGRMFDGIIDTRLTVFEALALIASYGRASFGMRDGLYTVIRDLDQGTPIQHFTPRNSWGFEGTRTFLTGPKALRVQFCNPSIGYVNDERMVYDVGQSVSTVTSDADIEALDLTKGCVDAPTAHKEGKYHLAQNRLRQNSYRISCDIENLVCTRGDLVYVEHDVPQWGLDSARITSLTLNVSSQIIGVTVDEPFTFEAGKSYVIRVRLQDGTSVVIPCQLSGGTTSYANLDLVPNVDFLLNFDTLTVLTAAGGPGTGNSLFFGTPLAGVYAGILPGDLVMFGENGTEVIALIVSKIEPGPELSATLTLLDYQGTVRDADNTLPPLFTSSVVRPIAPPVPVIVQVRSDSLGMTRSVDGSLQPAILIDLAPSDYPIAGVEARIRGSGTDNPDGAWTDLGLLLPASNRVTITNVEPGRAYDIMLRYRLMDGTTTDWVEIDDYVVTGNDQVPPDVTGLQGITGRFLYWDRVNAPDLDHYEIRVTRLGDPAPQTWANANFVDTTATQNYTYNKVIIFGAVTFRIKAVNTAGNYSAVDATITVTS